MASITAAQFRANIKTRLRVNAPTPEWVDAEIDAAGAAAFNAAFPALYKKLIQTALIVTQNSTTLTGTVTVTDTSRVYKLMDSDWDEVVKGWDAKDDTTIARIPDYVKKVDVYSYVPINYDTSNPMTVPDEWLDALYLYAQGTLLETLMGDKSTRLILPYTANEETLGAMQANFYNKYERERDAHAMGMPVRII